MCNESGQINSANIILLEIQRLYEQIRITNDRILQYTRTYFLYAAGFVTFTGVGLRLMATQEYQIALLSLLYGLSGLMMTFGFALVTYMGISQLSVSKRHRVRYWKQIHIFRQYLSKEYKEYGNCNYLPRMEYYKHSTPGSVKISRPNVSPGEFNSGLLIVTLAWLFFSTFIVYYTVFFYNALYHFYHHADIFSLEELFAEEAPIIQGYLYGLDIVLIFSLAYPRNLLWSYYKNLQSARICSRVDMFERYLPDRHSYKSFYDENYNINVSDAKKYFENTFKLWSRIISLDDYINKNSNADAVYLLPFEERIKNWYRSMSTIPVIIWIGITVWNMIESALSIPLVIAAYVFFITLVIFCDYQMYAIEHRRGITLYNERLPNYPDVKSDFSLMNVIK